MINTTYMNMKQNMNHEITSVSMYSWFDFKNFEKCSGLFIVFDFIIWSVVKIESGVDMFLAYSFFGSSARVNSMFTRAFFICASSEVAKSSCVEFVQIKTV